MTGAEAIAIPALIGAAVGSGTAAARGGSAANIALSGLAGGTTGGFGGWMAAPAAGAAGTGAGAATVPATTAGTTLSGAGIGPLGLYASPTLGETAAEASTYGMSGVGPLTATGLYASPALGEVAAAPTGAGNSFLSQLGRSWDQMSKKDVKEAVTAGFTGQQFVGKDRKRKPVPTVEPIRAEGYEAVPIAVKAIPTSRAVNPISQDILRNYIASIRRR